MSNLDEFELIDLIIKELDCCVDHENIVVPVGDDAGVVTIPSHCNLVVSTDVLVEGTHFPIGAPADLVGYRAMMVNFSDLAAMGAIPYFHTVALTIEDGDEDWIQGFAKGIAIASQKYKSFVLGGNLSRGPKSIAVTVHGLTPKWTYPLERNCAEIGDDIWLTGKVGTTVAYLEEGRKTPDLSILQLIQTTDEAAHKRYFLPQPRIELASRLRRIANAAIDVSDGLLADLKHITTSSKCGARVNLNRVPVWASVPPLSAVGPDDSYELLFTAPLEFAETIQEIAEVVNTPVSRIGSIGSKPGVRLYDAGELIQTPEGYSHF